MTIDALSGTLDFDAAALRLRAQRTQMLASNLANADTPDYKARDFNFAQALQAATGVQINSGVQSGSGVQSNSSTQAGSAAAAAPALAQTEPGHLSGGTGGSGGPTLLYRLPVQSSLDGNTVEPDVERAAFVDNSLRYQEGLKYMTNQIKTMLTAVNGQ